MCESVWRKKQKTHPGWSCYGDERAVHKKRGSRKGGELASEHIQMAPSPPSTDVNVNDTVETPVKS